MMRTYRIVLFVFVLLPLLAIAAQAQQKPPEPDKRTVVKVQVVLSRYEGDRKTSSLPFTMLATADGDRVSIRTGTQVPIATAAPENKTNFQYIDVGSNVDLTVKSTESGRFNVYLNFQDRSTTEKVPLAGNVQPVLRNMQYTNSVLIKDGETKQFVAASDKASGEMIKIDVTLNVEK
jgi:hypothetical protein